MIVDWVALRPEKRGGGKLNCRVFISQKKKAKMFQKMGCHKKG
jgi:hypothetical protein